MTTTDVLAAAVRDQIQRGWRVESQVGGEVILAKGQGKRCNHGMHLLLSALTVGAWLPFYALAALKRWQFRTQRQAVRVDESGKVELLPL